MRRYIFCILMVLLAQIVFIEPVFAANRTDLAQIQRAANEGNLNAIYTLGSMYRTGQGGVQKDVAKGIQLLNQAAAKGHAPSQNDLGFMYVTGQGVPVDYNKALEWFSSAAGRGSVEAQNNLGAVYENGAGVPKNYQMALEWYKKAAANGHAQAHANVVRVERLTQQKAAEAQTTALGQRLAALRRAETEREAAAQRQAAAERQAEAERKAAERQAEAERKATAERKAAAEQRQLEAALQKTAETGDPNAQNELGRYYDRAGNMREAAHWYQKAAEQGHAFGQYNLAYLYAQGRGVVKDEAKALQLYEKAAKQGNVMAQVNLGLMYENGNGTAKNKAKALEWYQKAEKLGDQKAKLLSEDLRGVWDCSRFTLVPESRTRSRTISMTFHIPSGKAVTKVILDDKYNIPSYNDGAFSDRAYYMIQSHSDFDFNVLTLHQLNRVPNKVTFLQPSGKTCSFQQDRSY